MWVIIFSYSALAGHYAAELRNRQRKWNIKYFNFLFLISLGTSQYNPFSTETATMLFLNDHLFIRVHRDASEFLISMHDLFFLTKWKLAPSD